MLSQVSQVVKIVFAKEIPGIGDKIKKLRKESDKDLTQLAAEAGVSVNHWYRIEKEVVRELPVETLRGIEKALNVDFGIGINN